MNPNTNVPSTSAVSPTDVTTPSTSGRQAGGPRFKGNKVFNKNQARNGSRFKNKKKSRSGVAPRSGASALPRVPINAYLSVCCSAPARKPQTGRKDKVQNPENGKTKEQPKGLGKWRCSQCGKPTKVTVQKTLTSPTTQTETVGTEVTVEAPTV